MEKFSYKDFNGVKWLVKNPVGVVVIAHGMAETIYRYNYFACALNNFGYSVYGINHIGHGDMIGETKQGHFEKGDFAKCVDNLNELVKLAKMENPGLTVFLFGHSMGSFMAQRYAQVYGRHIGGLILSGSNGPSAIAKFGSLTANIVGIFSKADKPNNIMNSLSFGSFNKQFKPAKTEFDWLCDNDYVVNKYIEDPKCGFVCTTSFFKEFLAGMVLIHRDSELQLVPKNLPIYIFSGDKDPVGNNGVGVKKLYNLYKEYNIYDVSMKLYENGRHEMLNEKNNDVVFNDVCCWLKKHTATMKTVKLEL